MSEIQIAILAIGDEITSGDIVDTNSSFICSAAGELGIQVPLITSVGDEQEVISEVLLTALQKVPVVIVTGGLGPTTDDITRDAIAKFLGKNLVLNWESDRVIAEALRPVPSDWEIVLHGGATRTEELGPAEISLILCHELGHHLGGKPTAAREGWSACEGQADYWSSFECIRNFSDLLKDTVASSEAVEWCERHFPGSDENCGKFAQAALNVTRFYGHFQPSGYPNLETIDINRTSRTFYGHPQPQCRLDTLMAGYFFNPRPLCWYHE